MAAHARQQYFADEESIQKQAREFSLVDELKDKLDSIEWWAQVNVIEEVKENGVPLEIVDKSVNVEVPLVIDNLYTIDPDNSLSAKQGKILYDLIQNLASRGRYLSNWNAATWLPTTNPVESPYEYRAWDYYIVSNVAAQWGTNYRPEVWQYIIGQASDEVEQETVKVTDMYLYDGTNWNLLINSTREIAIDSSLSTTSTNPVENRVVTNAINTKQDILIAWNNIQIASDGKTISSTDTTYTAWTNIQIDANNQISATDTTYTAWANIQIDANNQISATDTVYAEWTGIDITNNIISNEWVLTVNGNNWNVTVNDVKVSSTAPANPTEWMIWYDTTNDQLKAWDGTNWNVTWKVYTAWDWIAISAQNVISNTRKSVAVSQTAPANPSAWDLWYNTTKDVMFLYDWSDWTIIGPEIYPITKADYDALSNAEKTDWRFFLITDNDWTIYVDWANVQNKPEIQTEFYTVSSTAPSNPDEWDQWYDTTNDVLKVYDWTNWIATGKAYTAWNGIIINNNNEISVDSTILNWKVDKWVNTLSQWATSLFSIDDDSSQISFGTEVTATQQLDVNETISSTIGPFGVFSEANFNGDRISNDIEPNWMTMTDSQNYLRTAININGISYYNEWDDFETNHFYFWWWWNYQIARLQDIKTYTAWTNIDISAQNVISADTQFVVVDTLPAIATADENKVYILWPIGTWADKYEEYVAKNVTIPGHFESATSITHEVVTGSSGIVWNSNWAITNVCVWVNNVQFSEDSYMYIDDNWDSWCSNGIFEDTPMPYICEWPCDDWTYFYEVPMALLIGNATFDLYYSSSPLTWVAETTTKQYIKIWETSPDLSGKQDKATSGSWAPSTTPTYVGQMYVDTTNDNLYVATGTSSSSDWTAVDTNTTYTAWDRIDITNNIISADKQFEVVSTLPSVATASEDKVYILWPLNVDWADKYEEWIVAELQAWFVSDSPITHIAINEEVKDIKSYTWNWYDTENPVTDVYVWINNYTPWEGVITELEDDDNSVTIFLDRETFPYVYYTGDTYLNWRPMIYARVEHTWTSSVAMDLYYSDSPLTRQAAGRQWIKIWETSADLSNYLAKNNTTSYTPSWDYNPATKKYVDDNKGKKDIVISQTAPSDKTVLWFNNDPNTSTAADLLYYNNYAGGSWQSVWWIYSSSLAPGGSNKLWYDTSDSTIKYYDNDTHSWEPVWWVTYVDWFGIDFSSPYWDEVEIAVDPDDLAWSWLSVNQGNWQLQVDTTVIQEKLTAWDGIDIDNNNEISVDASDLAWTWLSTDANNNLIVDTTVIQEKLIAWDGITIGNVCTDISDMQWPAPKWFHVPLTTEWQWLKTIMDWLSLTTWDNWRINLHIPLAGRRSYSNAVRSKYGSIGSYWSSSPYRSSNPNDARYLYLDSSDAYASEVNRRADGFSVRCFKDSYETPTSSWTIITWTLWWAWIFRNQTDWLISITSNWTTWYTIQDKNLWATTVYNNWDTLSEANCGKYYQWGNNYWFPSTWSITTSSTQVNAQNYWPWNYYSSSTFIIWSNNWSSVSNDNLRWWVSQWSSQECDLTISADTTVVATKTDLSWKQDKFHTTSSSAPSNPSEWDEWYDTTNDVLKVYDWTNWIATGKTYTAWTWINISNQNVISADTTVLATKSDIANLWSFTVVDTLPSVSSADEKTIYLLGPIWTGADKYEEWIVTNQLVNETFYADWTPAWNYDPSHLNLSNSTTLTYISSEWSGNNWFILDDNLWNVYWYYTSNNIFQNTWWYQYDEGTWDWTFIDSTSVTVPAWNYELNCWGGDSSFDSITISTWASKQWTKIWETSVDLSNYLAKNNTTAFTPTWNYNPATKKYVDDNKGKNDIIVGDTTPSDETVLWYWYSDWDSNVKSFKYSNNYIWIDIESIWYGSSAPTTYDLWTLWYDINNNQLKYYEFNNDTWKPVGWITSSNNTYDNIVHLSQAEYDNLQTKDPNTLYSTPDSESGWFEPENTWTTWQVLTKTATWYSYQDVPTELPSWWSTWQVLTKTSNWVAFQNVPTELPSWWTTWQVLTKTSNWVAWQNSGWTVNFKAYYWVINLSSQGSASYTIPNDWFIDVSVSWTGLADYYNSFSLGWISMVSSNWWTKTAQYPVCKWMSCSWSMSKNSWGVYVTFYSFHG